MRAPTLPIRGPLSPWHQALIPSLVLGIGACGGSSGPDPQTPSAQDNKVAAATIVICPEGSTYDPGRNACIATAGVTGTTQPAKVANRGGDANVRVKCDFNNGWVAVLPENEYPRDDEFIMQALIGFTEEPSFWSGQNEYATLGNYAAKRCTRRGESFSLEAGTYFILVGEADTFHRRGDYRNNGYRKRVRLTAGETFEVDLGSKDLTHSWLCISCPWVSFYDPLLGRYLPAFVILAYRNERRLRGTDRILVHEVPVQDGKIRLRVTEVEPEVSYLDQLVLEVQGVRVLPSLGGAHSALADVDGVNVEMSRGTEIVVEYEVPHVQGSTTTVTVVAHGHYEPTFP